MTAIWSLIPNERDFVDIVKCIYQKENIVLFSLNQISTIIMPNDHVHNKWISQAEGKALPRTGSNKLA